MHRHCRGDFAAPSLINTLSLVRAGSCIFTSSQAAEVGARLGLPNYRVGRQDLLTLRDSDFISLTEVRGKARPTPLPAPSQTPEPLAIRPPQSHRGFATGDEPAQVPSGA